MMDLEAGKHIKRKLLLVMLKARLLLRKEKTLDLNVHLIFDRGLLSALTLDLCPV